MPSPLPPSPNGSRPSARAAAHCPSCGAGIAADQRYCLACGARLQPVRAEVRAAIDGWRGVGPAAPIVGTLAPGTGDDDADLTPVPVPAPWQSAAAVLAVLAFGVFAGGVANPSLSFALAPQQPTITARCRDRSRRKPDQPTSSPALSGNLAQARA